MASTPAYFEPADRVSTFAETVWHEFSPLAVKFNACNLGQGFPNWQPEPFVLQAAHDAINGNLNGSLSIYDPQPTIVRGGITIGTYPPNLINQYTRSGGHMPLARKLAEFYGPKLGRTLDPNTDVITTAGASEALYALIAGLVSPSDEVILMEPFFDIYIGAVVMAGATPRYVRLERNHTPGKTKTADDFKLDLDALRATINEKTRLIVLNTPQNPTGKVFSLKELEELADIVKAHPRLMIVSDEVYEWLTYDGAEHIRLATLPGMWDRTLTVSSAGKTFSATGWKTGWIIGPGPAIQSIMRAHQFIVFCIATPLQHAIATAITEAEKINFFSELRQKYLKKRDFMLSALEEAGLNPIVPQGSFFIVSDISDIKLEDHEGRENLTGLCMDVHDWRVSRWLTKDYGVTTIPCSSFYDDKKPVTDLIRFAFCKTDDVLEAARDRLLKLKDRL